MKQGYSGLNAPNHNLILLKLLFTEKMKMREIDFPVWISQSLDKEAKRLGVPRQSIIKIWLAESLKQTAGCVVPSIEVRTIIS